MAEEIEFAPLEGPVAAGGAREPDLHHLHDVPVDLAVELGRTRMTIGETLKLGPGSIVSLNRLAGEPVDLLVNGKPIARGEVVVIDEEFGLRITDIVAAAQRVDAAEEGGRAPAPSAPLDPALAGEQMVAGEAGAHPPLAAPADVELDLTAADAEILGLGDDPLDGSPSGAALLEEHPPEPGSPYAEAPELLADDDGSGDHGSDFPGGIGHRDH